MLPMHILIYLLISLLPVIIKIYLSPRLPIDWGQQYSQRSIHSDILHDKESISIYYLIYGLNYLKHDEAGTKQTLSSAQATAVGLEGIKPKPKAGRFPEQQKSTDLTLPTPHPHPLVPPWSLPLGEGGQGTHTRANSTSHKLGKSAGLDNESDQEAGQRLPSAGERTLQGRVQRGPQGIKKGDGRRHIWEGKEDKKMV